jgi:hypothetical protein
LLVTHAIAFYVAIISIISIISVLSVEFWTGAYNRNGFAGHFTDYARSCCLNNSFEIWIDEKVYMILVSENIDEPNGYTRLPFGDPCSIDACSPYEINIF